MHNKRKCPLKKKKKRLIKSHGSHKNKNKIKNTPLILTCSDVLEDLGPLADVRQDGCDLKVCPLVGGLGDDVHNLSVLRHLAASSFPRWLRRLGSRMKRLAGPLPAAACRNCLVDVRGFKN